MRYVSFRNNVFLLVLFVSICFLGSIKQLVGQEKDKTFSARNSVYADFASKGAYYSVNYDRIFHQSKKIAFTYRLGFSILGDALAFPIGINLFTRKENSHLEFSFTLIPYIDHYNSFLSSNDLSDKYIYIVPGIGYRYQKPIGGLFFKAVVSPMIFLDPPSDDFWKMDPKLYVAANVGIGYCF